MGLGDRPWSWLAALLVGDSLLLYVLQVSHLGGKSSFD
jgi:hypothetical protein